MRDEVKARAGRLGGLKTKRSMDTAFYRRIGAKGRATLLERYGRDFFVEIGRLGGNAAHRSRGPASKVSKVVRFPVASSSREPTPPTAA